MAHSHYCVKPPLWLYATMVDRSPQSKDKFIVRLPDGMRDRLREAAEQNNRSMNAEIINRLERPLNGVEVQLPEELRDRVEAAARINGRSVNVEIVYALQDRYPTEPTLEMLAKIIEQFGKWAASNDRVTRMMGRAQVFNALDVFRDIIEAHADDLPEALPLPDEPSQTGTASYPQPPRMMPPRILGRHSIRQPKPSKTDNS